MSIVEPSRRIDPRVSSRRAIVVIEEAAEPLTTANAADMLDGACVFDQLVRKALMIPLTIERASAKTHVGD